MTAWEQWLKAELDDLDRQCLRRHIVTPRARTDREVTLDDSNYVNFTSNDYLGLSSHPKLAEAAHEASQRYGTSVAASRLLLGSTPLHDELEVALATLKKTESSLLFSSGYLANLGTLAGLAGPDDVIFSDELNHASIIDGCRLTSAIGSVYKHCDMDHLEKLLKQTPSKKRLIVSESVFSMDGDLAPVPDLIRLAERYDALVVLDEAHATGTLGADGAGALSHFSITSGPIVIVGTLSKALGSIGGFVATNHLMRTILLNRCRPFVFDTALSPAAVAAALTAIQLAADEPWRRETALARAATLRTGLPNQGTPAGASASQIVPYIVGEANDALRLELKLQDAGILAKAIRPPTVPKKTSRVRFNVTAAHTEADVQRILETLA